jgi:mono/diheme cytochrome c family protein
MIPMTTMVLARRGVVVCGSALALALVMTAVPAAQADGPAKPAAKPVSAKSAAGKTAAAMKPAPAAVDAKAIYEAKCQVCHMADGNSQLMPNMSFADGVWAHGSTLKAVETTITNGVPGTAMVAWKEQLTPAEITAMAKFVRKFDKKLK